MWEISLHHVNGTVTRAWSVTRQEGRNWARQYRAPGDTVTITRPSDK